jgi:hypothetical protein
MAAKKAKPLLVGCIAVVTLGLGVSVFALVFFLVRPRGEKVAEIDLTSATAEVLVDANTGDSLYFSTDVAIPADALATHDSHARDSKVTRFLRGSTLTVRATSPNGAELSTSCPIYNGRSSITSDSDSTYSMSGLLNDCVLSLDGAGKWKVQPSVVWQSPLPLQSAILDVRREAAKK